MQPTYSSVSLVGEDGIFQLMAINCVAVELSISVSLSHLSWLTNLPHSHHVVTSPVLMCQPPGPRPGLLLSVHWGHLGSGSSPTTHCWCVLWVIHSFLHSSIHQIPSSVTFPVPCSGRKLCNFEIPEQGPGGLPRGGGPHRMSKSWVGEEKLCCR